jgi:hypothetical protein
LKLRLLLTLLAAIAVPAVAGEASGEFKVTNRTPIRPKYAAAYETRDQRDPRKHIVEVVLSSEPIDTAAAVADLDPHTNVINQPALMDHDYILLWVRPGNDVSMNATYGARMVQFVDMTGDMGSLKAEMKTNTADRVEGRLWSPKPVKTQDETWTVDVHFATDVTRLPAATRLPADGGDPGKAFKALLAARLAKKLDAIQKNVVKPFDSLADALSTLDIWLPKKGIEITGGEVHGDSAVLEVEGEMFPGMKGLFLVGMKKSGSRWLFDRAVRGGLID